MNGEQELELKFYFPIKGFERYQIRNNNINKLNVGINTYKALYILQFQTCLSVQNRDLIN